MKQFSFSLQRLMDYKEQLFEAERRILADMRGVLARMQQDLIDLENEHVRRSVEFNRKAARGTTAQEFELHKMYMRMVDASIEQKKHQIVMQVKAIDKQADKVRASKMEVSTMEKLRERKLEEYRYMENKETEQFIEEYVTSAKAMAALQGGG